MKRIFSCLLSFSLALSCLPMNFTVSAEETDTAEVVLGKNIQQTGFKAVESGTNTTPTVAVRDNFECWLMDNQAGDSSAHINFALADAFKHKKQDGSVYEITVEYYDTGFGYFNLQYDSLNSDKQLADIIYMNNEKMWKSQTFSIDDAEFAEKLDGKFDFCLSIKGRSGSSSSSTSASAVGIRKVSVERKAGVNPVWVSSQSDREGNAFEWFSDEKIIHNTYKNLTENDTHINVTHKLVSKAGYQVYEKSEEIDILAGEEKKTDFNFSEFKLCDVYDYYVEIKDNEGKINSNIYTMTLAVLKTDPDGITDERIQFSAHFAHTTDRLAHKAMWEILKLGNIRSMREGADWQSTESTRGSLGYPSYVEQINNDFREHGFIKDPGGFYYAPAWMSGGLTLPKGEEELAAWENFVRFAIDEQKEITDRYEIWNEPNIKSFNRLLDERGAVEYMEAFKVAAKVIEEKDPGALVGGPSVTGIQYSQGRNFWKECLENGFAEIPNTAIVLHPYTVKPIETSGIIEDVLEYKQEYIDAGGSEDVELWHTEVGYTLPDEGIGTDRVKGALNVRSALAYFTHDAGDRLNFYNLEKKGYIKTDREDMFGSVSYKGTPWGKYEKRCTPTEAYVQMTALTYILAKSEIESHKISEDNNLYMSLFDSEKFGKKILTIHTVNEAENITLNLGTDKVTLFDEYGNETEVFGNNGIFEFCANNYPQYIMGDITKYDIVNESGFLTLDTDGIIAAEKDVFTIGLENHTDKNYEISVVTPENIKLKENTGFSNKKATLAFENLCEKGEESFVEITVLEDKNVVFEGKILVKSEDLMSTELSVSLDDIKDSSKWSGKIKIKNHSKTKTLTGDIKFTSDDFFSEIKPLNVGIIPPGRTGEVEFSLPNVVRKGQYYPKYEVNLKDGGSFEFTDSAEFTLAKYASVKPTIDGVIEAGEWSMDTAMYADNEEQISTTLGEWTPDDISGKSVVMWDEENYYMCAVITDDKHVNNRPAAENWNGDNMQFGIFYGDGGFVAIGQANTTFHEISMALSSVTGDVTLYRFMSQDDSHPAGEIKDATCAIKRVGNKTYYEFLMPWEKLLRPGDKPKAGDMLGYSFVINEGDSNVREGYIQYASGIAASKDTSLFTYMMLLK